MPRVAVEPAKRDVIKDRKTLTDRVATWMYDNCPSWTIDTLLTHPDMAAAMAKWVLRKMGRRVTAEAIHEVCRRAEQPQARRPQA